MCIHFKQQSVERSRRFAVMTYMRLSGSDRYSEVSARSNDKQDLVIFPWGVAVYGAPVVTITACMSLQTIDCGDTHAVFARPAIHSLVMPTCPGSIVQGLDRSKSDCMSFSALFLVEI